MVTTTDPIKGLLYINNGYDMARWNFDGSAGSIGRATTVTYSFGSDRPSYAFGPDFASITTFSPEYQAATRSALAQVSSVSNLRFVEAAPGEQGDIVFRHSAQEFTSGFAYSPDFEYSLLFDDYTPTDYAGDVWIDNIDRYTGAEMQPGGRGYFVLMHELGHALGLQHSFDDTGGASPPPYVMAGSLDNEAHTVMSYTQAPRTELLTVTGDEFDAFIMPSALSAQTLMPLDIKALQHLYGANTATRAGNSTYTWGTNAEILQTIWDGGGIDTIDASNQIFKNVINLNAGQYSSIGLRQTDAQIRQGLDLPGFYTDPLSADIYNGQNNLAIASGVVIENATGGSAADQITGNGAANRLKGGGGNDTLVGGAGNDILDGNAGSDRMSGGTGADSYYVTGGDVVIEAAGAGVDTVFTGLANYVLATNVENGRINTTGSANLAGNGLANLVHAGTGSNVLDGGAGVDTVSYQYGGSAVVVNLGSTAAQATGGSGTDTLSGFENLTGSQGADRLTGSLGNNNLSGLGGNDTIAGGAGRDVLRGGAGNDVFDFNVASHSGLTADTRDVISDFSRGQDRIDLATIDALPSVGGNNVFTFLGTAAFGANASGQLRFAFDSGSGAGILYGSTDADAAAEFSIALAGVRSLDAGDIVL